MILDANERLGDAWRKRWDSLRLFTPATFSALPGYRLPRKSWSYPTKDEQADYLEDYAARFDLPVQTGVAVERVSRDGDRFIVSAGARAFEAVNVIVATGAHQIARVPQFAADLDPRIVQLHSSEYRNPSQLQNGNLLVVGAGNSGAEIALELSHSHVCSIAGPKTGPDSRATRHVPRTLGLPRDPLPRPPRAESRHAPRSEARAEADRARRSADPNEAA